MVLSAAGLERAAAWIAGSILVLPRPGLRTGLGMGVITLFAIWPQCPAIAQVLVAGDQVEFLAEGREDFSDVRTVDQEGEIGLPGLGGMRIRARGKELNELEGTVRETYAAVVGFEEIKLRLVQEEEAEDERHEEVEDSDRSGTDGSNFRRLVLGAADAQVVGSNIRFEDQAGVDFSGDSYDGGGVGLGAQLRLAENLAIVGSADGVVMRADRAFSSLGLISGTIGVQVQGSPDEEGFRGILGGGLGWRYMAAGLRSGTEVPGEGTSLRLSGTTPYAEVGATKYVDRRVYGASIRGMWGDMDKWKVDDQSVPGAPAMDMLSFHVKVWVEL